MSDVRRSKSYVWCPMFTVRCMMSDVWCPMSDLDVRCAQCPDKEQDKKPDKDQNKKSEKKTDKKRGKRSTKIPTKNRTKDRTKNKRNDRTKKWDEKTEHYMAAWVYEFYLRVLKVSLTSERSERVRDAFSARRENSYPQAAMKCSFYFIDTDEIPT